MGYAVFEKVQIADDLLLITGS